MAQDREPTAVRQPHVAGRRLSPDQMRQVAPALKQFIQQHLYGDVWQRPDLSWRVVAHPSGLLFQQVWQPPYLPERDRSLVTIAALIADGKAEQLTDHLNRGMGQGLTQAQLGR